jgi:Ca2+-binding RTX toxin-like protein
VVQGLNHITISIADTGDHVLDSGLFISNLTGTDLPTSGVVLDRPCTDGDDSVTATAASEIIDAKAGDDSVAAGAGDDVVQGGLGNDSIEGGAGTDYIDGGEGVDEACYAGVSDDYHVVKLANGHYRVESLALGAPEGTDELTNVETLVFADGAFAVAGWDVPPPPAGEGVTITGTEEDDTVTYLATVAGEPGITDAGDVIDLLDGNDKVHAGAGDDTILAGAGHDELGGGGGDDRLVGGADDDDLTGGSGADTFVFGEGDSPVDPAGVDLDRILDFNRAQGDLIDLSAIGSFALADALGGDAFLLAQTDQDDGWLLEGDVDGDGQADLAIFVVTALKLAAGDFVM